MQESKGVETPQSNFCVNDIKKVIGMYNFVKQNASDDFEEYKKAAEAMEFGIKLISAQEKVPEGSSFKVEFDKILKGWFDIVAKYEPIWREKHKVVWDALVAYEQAAVNASNAEQK